MQAHLDRLFSWIDKLYKKIISIFPQRKLRFSWAVARKGLYLSTFFLITPLTILLSLLAINFLEKEQVKKAQSLAQGHTETIQTPNYGTQIFASLPSTTGEVKGEATATDARQEILKQYMQRYNSPLEPQAQFIVDTAEKYDLDFRLLVAIAQQESNLCKKIPEGTYNCWGWGIHERGTLGFDSFEEGIETVAKGLKEEYIDKGYITPEQIMSKYTPASPGSWAKGVNQFLAEME